MLDAKARWNISKAREEAAASISEALGIDPLIAKLLTVRGIVEVEEAERFLNGGTEQFHDPFLLKGMEEAVARIRLALERKEKIRVYGDYDADGISSTTLMIRLMERLEADFDTYIPHRVQEGYGLNRDALGLAKASGVGLIVTVDTGISAREEIAYASELGMDVVVTDHHEPPELLPDAAAIVNPKQPGCTYPFKHLAGVGVAFKLSHALLGEPPLEWLEIAAIGTVADIMPLVDENRKIVKLGLERMRGTQNHGLRALLAIAGIDRDTLTETHIGFALAPRINASGRLTHANQAVKLLTTKSEQEAEHLAYELDLLNKERQKIVEDITKEALSQIKERGLDGPEHRVIVVSGDNWNVGVVGIVASKLLEKFYKPALVMAVDPETGMAKGSARSIAGFDIFHALNACKELLDHYGGHQAAAGLSLHKDKLQDLCEMLNAQAHAMLTDEDFIPIMQADIACSLTEAPLSFIEQLAQLAPFGNGNPSPRFVFEGLRISEKRTMGREQQHLKLLLAAAEAETACSVEAVGFGYGAAAELIAPTSRVDVLGELSVNEWNGTRRPQIMIQDIRVPRPQVFDWRGAKMGHGVKAPPLPEGCGLIVFSRGDEEKLPGQWLGAGRSVWLVSGQAEPELLLGGEDEAAFEELSDALLFSLPPYEESLQHTLGRLGKLKRLYAVFADAHDGSAGSLPDRESFKSIYALLGREQRVRKDDDRIWSGLSKRTGLSKPAVALIVKVFQELGFIQYENGIYSLVPSPAKRDLTDSETYRRQMNRGQMEQSYIYCTAHELAERLLAYLLIKND